VTLLARFHALPEGGLDPLASLRIEPGTPDDLRALSRFHYRPGTPATIVQILRAAPPSSARGPSPLAILAISLPTLNSSWRAMAWPELAAGPDKATHARRLNDQLRTISRVIVDPRVRGLGLARRLVRHYLHHPLTPATEAVASMGACCPFFAQAGMTEFSIPPAARDRRLLHALAEYGLTPQSLLHLPGAPQSPARAARRHAGTSPPPAIAHALHQWANASRATRRLLNAPIGRLARAAAGGPPRPPKGLRPHQRHELAWRLRRDGALLAATL
jgi:predicted GNAT family acetyltransferase